MAEKDWLLEPSPNGGRRRQLRPRQTPTDKLASGSATVRLEGYFQLAYERAWHHPYYQTSPAEDRGHLKRMVDQLGEPQTRELIDAFFRAIRPVTRGGEGDPVVSKSKSSGIRALSYHLEYLLLRQQRGTRAERSVENEHEIAKATGRTRS